jgi:eukaryotic-like serine/threonine-protein kinase
MSQKRMIGQFEVQELLGEGGIGQVFAARDTVLDRVVAIKSLRAELLSDKSFVERFRAEAKNLALLSHPNITTLYTLLEEGGSLYMMMELVRGRTLETILSERGAPFTMQEALAIVAQAADGLAYAHEMGIVHRDIKPANLILTNTGLLKIMDFGIARAQGSQRMTRDGSIVGTLAYMSPEQCRGQEVDGRTDLYSLGIVLYEMLTGKVPFEASTDYDLMQAHINTPAEWPSRLIPGIEPHAEKALMKALSKKASDRFATLTAFKDALGAPASRTEALSIVHKVTRLAGTANVPTSLPAFTAVVSNVTDSMKKSSVPFALRGVAIGAGLALALAGVALYFISPGSTPSPLANQNILPATKLSAPAGLPQTAPQAQNPYLVDTRKLTNTNPVAQSTPQLSDTRQPQPPNNAASKTGTGSRLPFEVAAEPRIPGPAAASQPPGSQTADAQPVARTASAIDKTPSSAAANTPASPAVDQGADATAAAQSETVAAADSAAPSDATAAPDTPSQKPAVRAPSDGRRMSEKDVVAAYETKNFANARELAEPCAKEGNPECQFILGRLFETGSAGQKDLGTAADWYRKAAEAGLAKARFNLGALYYAGEGLPKDARLAAEWFSKAAYQNHSVAQFNLANLYENGDGVPRNLAEARRWYTEVVEKASDRQLAADAQEALDRLGTGERRRRRR